MYLFLVSVKAPTYFSLDDMPGSEVCAKMARCRAALGPLDTTELANLGVNTFSVRDPSCNELRMIAFGTAREERLSWRFPLRVRKCFPNFSGQRMDDSFANHKMH